MELLNAANFGTISQFILITYGIMFLILLTKKDEFLMAYQIAEGEIDPEKFNKVYIILFILSPIVLTIFTIANLYRMIHVVLFKKEPEIINKLEDMDDNDNDS